MFEPRSRFSRVRTCSQVGWLLGVAACTSAVSEPPLVRSPSQHAAALAPTTDCTDRDLVDVLHHDVALAVRLQPEVALTGKGSLRVRAPRDTSAVLLDAVELKVSSAKVNGVATRWHHDGERLCVVLPAKVAAGAEVLLDLSWEVSRDGPMPQFWADQVWAGYRASAWMPTRQDSAQRATLSLRIAAPRELQVIASGRIGARVAGDADMVEHSFAVEQPTQPFLFAFAVGRFEVAERRMEETTLRAFVRPGMDATAVLMVTESVYQLLMDRTGTRLPMADYSQVFVQGDAAQEALGMAVMGEIALSDLHNDQDADWILSHELAHQWFAALVPCADFADFWLNEGFATFFVGIVKEHRLGPYAYLRELSRWRESSARVHALGKDAPLSLSAPSGPSKPPPADHELQARGVTYARGALVLHKLREELGEAVFWQGVRLYVKNRAGNGARSEDLRVALEEASQRDLREFFAKWVYAAAPDL